MRSTKAGLARNPAAAWAAMLIAVAVVAVAHHGPETAVLDDAADKKGPVTFPHAAHVEAVADCSTCHHTMEGLTAESDQDVKPCAACHLDPEEAGTPSIRQMSMSKNPYHMSCIGCHKDEGKGPTKCNDCHGEA